MRASSAAIPHHAVIGGGCAGLQCAVRGRYRLVPDCVENHISQQPNNKQETETTLKRLNAVEDHLGKPESLMADAGYFNEDNVTGCEAEEVKPYISDNRE